MKRHRIAEDRVQVYSLGGHHIRGTTPSVQCGAIFLGKKNIYESLYKRNAFRNRFAEKKGQCFEPNSGPSKRKLSIN